MLCRSSTRSFPVSGVPATPRSMIETKSLILDGPQVFFRIVLLERLTGIGYSSSACCVSLSVVFRGGCRAQCWLICGDNSGCLVVEECRSMCQQRIDVVNSVGKLLLPGLLLARACARQKEGAPVYQYGLQPLKFKLRRVHSLNDQPSNHPCASTYTTRYKGGKSAEFSVCPSQKPS